MLVRASGQPPGGWGTSSGESGRLTAPGTGWGRRDLPARGRGDTAKGPRSAPRPGPGPAGPGGQRARHPGAAAAPGREPGVGGGGRAEGAGGLGAGAAPEGSAEGGSCSPGWGEDARPGLGGAGLRPRGTRGRGLLSARRGTRPFPLPRGWWSCPTPSVGNNEPPHRPGHPACKAAGPAWEPGVLGAGAQLKVSEQEEHPAAGPARCTAPGPPGAARSTPVTLHQAVPPAGRLRGGAQRARGKLREEHWGVQQLPTPPLGPLLRR